MKSILLLLVLSLCSFSLMAAESVIRFNPEKTVIKAGETVSIAIAMGSEFPENQGGGLNLRFNPKVVQVTNVKVDSSTWSFFYANGQIDNTNGQVSDIIFARFPGASGAVEIATIEFRGVKNGNARLSLEESTVNPFSSNGERIAVSINKVYLKVRSNKAHRKVKSDRKRKGRQKQ